MKTYIASVAVALGGLLLSADTASAQWDPLRQARQARDRLGRGIAEEARRGINGLGRATGQRFHLVIRNPGRGQIFYSFNGRPSVLFGGNRVTWTGIGAADISFDNGRGQPVSHGLRNGGRYVFQWQGGVLRLFRE